MGFSVTASHVILLVTVIASASVLGTTYAGVTNRVHEDERVAARLREDQVHTALYVVDDATYPLYEPDVDRFTVRILNNGTTVLRVSEMVYLIDGVHANDRVSGSDVDGDTGTDFWMPGERLTVVFGSVATDPARFAAYAENGVGGMWRS